MTTPPLIVGCQIAIIYAILPFTIFLTPAGVGFLADKLGNFTRVLMLTVIGSAIFHTALLFIPTVTRTHFDSVQNSRYGHYYQIFLLCVEESVDFIIFSTYPRRILDGFSCSY